MLGICYAEGYKYEENRHNPDFIKVTDKQGEETVVLVSTTLDRLANLFYNMTRMKII